MFDYTYNVSDTANNKVDEDRLTLEIRSSAIVTALDHINVGNNNIFIYFKVELDSKDKTTLDGIIAAHTGEALAAPTQIVKSEVLTEHLKFVEAGDTTQGMYAAQSLIIDISAGELDKIIDFSWPYAISLMSGTLGVSEDMVGDDFQVDVGPNTLIGALIAPLSVGDTSIYVSPTVLENIKIDFYFGLYNAGGDTGVELGQIIARDDANNCLTLGQPSPESATAGSYVAMCAKIIPNLYIHSMNVVEIGKDVPTGQRIPKNLPVRVHYHNNNGVAKKISFFIEYLY